MSNNGSKTNEISGVDALALARIGAVEHTIASLLSGLDYAIAMAALESVYCGFACVQAAAASKRGKGDDAITPDIIADHMREEMQNQLELLPEDNTIGGVPFRLCSKGHLHGEGVEPSMTLAVMFSQLPVEVIERAMRQEEND